MKTAREWRWLAASIVAITLACASRHKEAGAPPAGDAVGSAMVDDLAAAEAELASNAAELASLGVVVVQGRRALETREKDVTPVDAEPDAGRSEPEPIAEPEELRKRPRPSPDVKPPPNDEPSKPPKNEADNDPKSSEGEPNACQRICALASVACDLSKRICVLADDHDGDARYEDACWNAERQCEQASDACSECNACGV